MKKSKAISFLLSLSILASMIIPGTLALPATTVYAEDGSSDKGMEISKTATPNEDGTYTITLEAYATGEKVISEITKDVPTDIILVLDQSGSMTEKMNTYGFREYTNKSNSDYYKLRHNGGSDNLWHKLPDGSFVSVSVTLQQTITYNKITKGRNDNGSNGYTNYWENRTNLYTYVNGEIKKVVYTRERDWPWENWNCKYALEDGTILNQNNEGSRHSPTFQNTDDGYLYLAVADESQNVYTYTYTDSNGTTQTIGTSTGANTQPTDFSLYERYQDGTVTRLQALKNAVTNFSNSVAEKAAGKDGQLGTDDDVDHRIAVVGFASGEYYGWDYLGYGNTEVFVGGNEYTYGTAARGQYKNAFQNMNTSVGVQNVSASIRALSADGGTLTNLGIEMANGIFKENPVPAGEKRNRVVIVFTDGQPGWSGYDSDTADSAIAQADTAKNTYGATVYTIGIFSGADATSAGDSNGNDTQKANWFMQKVSSNNGTPHTPSYYLSAGDSASLNNIFQQISDQIETGGSSSTLTSDAVVKDIISPQFTLPEEATVSSITLETYRCTGKNANGDYTWSKNADAMGAKASISDDQVNVTGFDFKENYVGTVTENGSISYRGNKLVISFKVEPKAGFLGGNDVYTNTSAGVYADATATDPVLTFPRPQVNVPIKDVTVTAADKNVYLLGDLAADQLKAGATVNVGGVPLKLTAENFGLEPWQNEYVDIEVAYKDKDGNTVTDLNDLTDDTTYTVSVNVSPKTTGAATERTGNGKGKINVFKPELTFKDSIAYYGEAVPTNNDYSSNRVGEKWLHDGTEAVPNKMLGTKPTLGITYTPDESKLDNGIYTKQDVPVSATVNIGTENVNAHTTFVHQDCAGKTCTLPENYHFWIHIQTCTLEIKKFGGNADEPYVFTVLKDGKEYSEVTVMGNGSETIYELPIGTYTVKEDTGWSWRYSANNGGSAALTAQNSTGTVTCTNTKSENYWLNGFSDVEKNIFGVSHNNHNN